jgi:pimeloyl-ACP methyl ester carboxylesterase
MDILESFTKNIAKNLDFLDRAEAIKTPTLILTGEKDPIATVKNANLLTQKLSEKSCHIIVPETSHNLIWEKTAVLMKHIKEFLNT